MRFRETRAYTASSSDGFVRKKATPHFKQTYPTTLVDVISASSGFKPTVVNSTKPLYLCSFRTLQVGHSFAMFTPHRALVLRVVGSCRYRSPLARLQDALERRMSQPLT